jgi:hypothetical protein
MIGLIVLALAAAWLFVSTRIARAVALKIKQPIPSFVLGVAVFLLAALAPFLDEIIGRMQFRHLCASEAKVWVSPTASKVVAAKGVGSFSSREGFIFPIREQWEKYKDAETGEVFYSVRAFHTSGGLLMRAGLGLGNSTSCWPEKWSSREVGLNIDELLERGKMR